MQPLSRLEQIEMMLVKTLKNMGGQILGYNTKVVALIQKYEAFKMEDDENDAIISYIMLLNKLC